MSQQGTPTPRADAVTDSVRRFLDEDSVHIESALVALSGGPDSVALLHASCAAYAERGVVVRACWVDHAIRPEAELVEEREFVEGLCAGLGAGLVVESAERGRILADAKAAGGVEAAARNFRYEALERARARARCDVILTGHNSDDFLETMIMRFCSGSGIAGLRGIPAASGRVRRPLLGVTKADILAYLGSMGLSYRTDSTNASDDYLRNRVRHDIVPALLSVFPSLRASLCTLARKASLDEEALDGFADALAAGGPDLGLDGAAFDAAPIAVRTRALYGLCASLGPDRLPWRLVLAAASVEKPRGRLASGAGVEFVRDGDLIRARAAEGAHGSRTAAEEALCSDSTARGFGFLARGTGEYRIGKAGACRIYSADGPEGLRADSFSWPVWVRSRRTGDAVRTRGGYKTLDSLAAELGIPAALRDEIPVIEDADGIVAFLASRFGGRDAYRRNDALPVVPAGGYLIFDVDLKGVSLTDAIRR